MRSMSRDEIQAEFVKGACESAGRFDGFLGLSARLGLRPGCQLPDRGLAVRDGEMDREGALGVVEHPNVEQLLIAEGRDRANGAIPPGVRERQGLPGLVKAAIVVRVPGCEGAT